MKTFINRPNKTILKKHDKQNKINSKKYQSETKLSKYCLVAERQQPNIQSQVGDRHENSAMET